MSRLFRSLIGGLLLVFGLWIIVDTCGAYWLETRTQNEGRRAQGHVTKKDEIIYMNDVGYGLRYWFVLPNGGRVEGYRDVSHELWSSLQEGDGLVVVYSAENPARNFPDGEGKTSLEVPLIGLILGTAITIIGISLMRAKAA